MYHRMGPVLPAPDETGQVPARRSFAQLYILEPDVALQQRMQILEDPPTADGPRRTAHGLDSSKVQRLEGMLRERNQFVLLYKSAASHLEACRLANAPLPDLRMRVSTDGALDLRRYNAPTGLGQQEVAGLIPEAYEGAPEAPWRTFCVQPQGGPLHTISDCHPLYHPLYYPLLYPLGTHGWHPGLLRRPKPPVPTRAGEGRGQGAGNQARPAGVAGAAEGGGEGAAGPGGGARPAPAEEGGGQQAGRDEPVPPGAAAEEGMDLDAQDRAAQAEIGMVARDEYGDVRQEDMEEGEEDEEGGEEGRGGGKRTKISCTDFHNFHMMPRPANISSNHLLRCGRLFQEYAVDAFCQRDNQRLYWLRSHQREIRADLYQNVQAAHAAGATAGHQVGSPTIVLPSSYRGGPRFMAGKFRDAMATVRHHGAKPDLFVTMTCNPNWPEIKDNLFPGQSSNDRPDLVARVFRLKLNALLQDLLDGYCLGRPIGHLHVIEFQKRGLPHAHILLILHPQDKLHSRSDYDYVCCAELPDKDLEPELYETVTTSMMHGPCGALNPGSSCMKDGCCTKNYPKQWQDATAEADGYPLMRRRDDGRYVEKVVGCGQDARAVRLDNRHVVPYNRCLSKKFHCHINVEICASIKSVKYLYKYVYKGHDCAQVQVTEVPVDGAAPPGRDEINEYLAGRYIGSTEALWRLFGFKMHAEGNPVMRLPVHLEGQHMVQFDEGARLEEVVRAGASPPSTLTAWFNLNRRSAPACTRLYQDLPQFYTWDKRRARWNDRKQKTPFEQIGRMDFVPRSQGERYFLRLLLTNVRGATSFAHLRTVTVNGEQKVCDTYQEAARLRGLLADDQDSQATMEEGRAFMMPAALRSLFASLLKHGDVADAGELWAQNKQAMAEDFEHDLIR
jgi:hypothetical protein